ncbi:MAG: hypothetical protein O7G85_09785 [Planctomycetota bacterium]|nr:hypothetical protein [Planctomycetota bacterium]
MWIRTRIALVALCCSIAPSILANAGPPPQSHARQWNEEMLSAIRLDMARPTVHARNLYHVSAAMWDAWAAYDTVADQLIHDERATATDIHAAREEAISYAAYRVLSARFASSPGSVTSLASFDARMLALGYDKANASTVGNTPAALGNRIAVSVLFHGFNDNANESGGYANLSYLPINPALLPDFPGNPDIIDPNRWQPLALDWFVDQASIQIGEYPEFLGPEWGFVDAFSL